MTFGKYTYGTPAIYGGGQNSGSLFVGAFCSIASGVTIFLGLNHRTDWVSTYPFGHIHQATFNSFDGAGHPSTKGDVVIGNDVWIGDGATIMSGVTIGDGVVVAKNSHVVKNAEPYTIIGGNPAKTIKYRFSAVQIGQLLAIRWWDWEDAKINQFAPLLCSNDIDSFIAAASHADPARTR